MKTVSYKIRIDEKHAYKFSPMLYVNNQPVSFDFFTSLAEAQKWVVANWNTVK